MEWKKLLRRKDVFDSFLRNYPYLSNVRGMTLISHASIVSILIPIPIHITITWSWCYSKTFEAWLHHVILLPKTLHELILNFKNPHLYTFQCRLSRNYITIQFWILISWNIKLYIHSTLGSSSLKMSKTELKLILNISKHTPFYFEHNLFRSHNSKQR